MKTELDEEEAREERKYWQTERMREAAKNAVYRAGLEIDPDSTYPIHVDDDAIEVSIFAPYGIDFALLAKLSGMVSELCIKSTRKHDVIEVAFKLLE